MSFKARRAPGDGDALIGLASIKCVDFVIAALAGLHLDEMSPPEALEALCALNLKAATGNKT
jgi:hypothetical protein